jgi:hypothetical protein
VTPPAALAATADPLAPVRETLRHMDQRPDIPAMQGITPGLTVTDLTGWVPATDVVSGARLDDMLTAAAERWHAAPHAAAALAWKCYSYWVSLPAVIGYAAARRVPLVRPSGVVVRWSPRQPFLTVGLSSVDVAVLPSDPLAVIGSPGIEIVPHEAALLEALRTSLMDEHLSPILGEIKSRRHLGRRTLWGSLASGVAHGISRAADVLPGPTMETAVAVLDRLGVADLVELGDPRPGRSGISVHRKTCCLAFTLPEPKICQGCVLTPR